jgi:AcrR family transcriptional regulator
MNPLPDSDPGPAPAPEAPARGGLRERKKARTRAAIRQQALRLFREQGYHATTVAQIAAAAEVSDSTFFRYFPTKEDVVLRDDMELLAAGALEAQPPELGPIAALRGALRMAFAALSADQLTDFRESAALAMSIPDVRARLLDELTTTIDLFSAALAQRAGRDRDDFVVRTTAGAVLGIALAAWLDAGDDLETYFKLFDTGLDQLEAGLPL